MSAPGSSGGGIEGECAACFDSTCGWQQTQCAGDPSCAEWLVSAKSCVADPLGRPAPNCLDTGLPSDPTGRSYAVALRDCLAAAQQCCSGSAQNGAAPGAGGGSAEDGAGGSDYGGMVDGGAGASSLDPSSLCPGCSCENCLFAIKHGEANDDTCKGAVLSCYDQNATSQCWDFALAYAACGAGAAGTDVTSPTACYQELYSAAEKAAAGKTFMTTVLPCAAQYCSAQCFPAADATCVWCQASGCLDALTAYYAEPDAQLFQWCRRSCEGETACIQACAAEHPNGLQVFQVLAQCTVQTCSSECPSL